MRVMNKTVSILMLFMMIPLAGCISHVDNDARHYNGPGYWAYQLQDIDPRTISRDDFQIYVIDYSQDGSESGEFSPDDLRTMKSYGSTILAYISIGEAESYRFYWNDAWTSNSTDWLGPENPEWEGNYAVKYWYPEWQSIIYLYLDRIIAQGFDGVYLDKVDEYEYWSYDTGLMSEEKAAGLMAEFIVNITQYCREKAGDDFIIVPQNGEGILQYAPWLLDYVNGWAAEDVFYNGTERNPPSIIQERTLWLDKVVESGKFVLSVDYVYSGNSSSLDKVRDYYSQAESRGYMPYAAMEDRELDEIVYIKGIQGKNYPWWF